LASIGRPLPSYVQRQNAIEGIVGEEAAAAFTGQKTIPHALSEAERRVDDLLAEVN
jgi:multiple sugar transport system substrate-binding protein